MDKCNRCGEKIDDEMKAKEWPVPVGDDIWVCPYCIDGGVCSEGHIKRGDLDSSACAECDILNAEQERAKLVAKELLRARDAIKPLEPVVARILDDLARDVIKPVDPGIARILEDLAREA